MATQPSDSQVVGNTLTLMEIYKEFGFESAHRLPNLPPEHKCSRLHGHSFRARIHVQGEPDPITGWVMDFAEIAANCEPVRLELDHRLLNDVPGLENPTSEVLARWIWNRLAPNLAGLCLVEVSETCTSGCLYRGA